MAWSYQPTDEGLSPKRLVHKNKFDTFESIFAFYSTFEAVSRILWVSFSSNAVQLLLNLFLLKGRKEYSRITVEAQLT